MFHFIFFSFPNLARTHASYLIIISIYYYIYLFREKGAYESAVTISHAIVNGRAINREGNIAGHCGGADEVGAIEGHDFS